MTAYYFPVLRPRSLAAAGRPPQYRRPAAERIGWERGMTILKDRIRELQPAYVPVDPVSRTVYRPGELAQCDLWFPDADIPLGYGQSGRPPDLVMVSG
ncbi:hypothetical protein ACFXMT_49320 [Streptomyces mirabilis]|uniref:hypothetical protein n=1 Tax=Streptomyces mirabilis TaxID=68239 RepID=UPI0036B7C958